MQRSSGSAERPADHSADSSAVRPDHRSSDVESTMASFATHNCSGSAEQPALGSTESSAARPAYHSSDVESTMAPLATHSWTDFSEDDDGWVLVRGDGTDDTTEGVSEYSGGTLSGVRLGYTQVELSLIANSHTLDGDGSRKRTLVRDSQGRCYTMAGMNRCAGDFTVPAGFALSKFQEPDFDPRWIRQPDSDDPPESICV